MIRVRYGLVPVLVNLLLGGAFGAASASFRGSDPTLAQVLLVLGIVIGLVGLVFPWRDAFRIEDETLVLPAVLGPVAKRFALDSVTCRGARVIAAGRPVGPGRSWCRRSEWERLTAALTGAQGGRPTSSP